MRALTICQPYAQLIALPDDDDRAKRVENRTWGTDYRGELLIHAGKGRDYLEAGDLEQFPGMPFGAVVAVANLVGCVLFSEVYGEIPEWACRNWPWLLGHEHVEGPVCWVLTEVRALRQPVPCKGERGLWKPSAEIIESVKKRLLFE